jgi:hypothetical protein
MTDANIPETPTEIAKRLWDTAVEHLEAASDERSPAVSDSYVRIGELALHAAQFAIANPGLLLGIPEDGTSYGLPAGAPPLPPGLQPRVWGAQK